MKPYIVILIPYLLSLATLSVVMNNVASGTKQRAQETKDWADSIELENIRVVNIQGGELSVRVEKGEPRLKMRRLLPDGLKISSDTLTFNGEAIWGEIEKISLPRIEVVNAINAGVVIFEQDTIR